MFGEVPESCIGKYDLVHIRLVQAVIVDDDPSILIRNAHQMLSELIINVPSQPSTEILTESGGWLQWEEVDHSTSYTSWPSQGQSTELDSIRRYMRKPKQGRGPVE